MILITKNVQDVVVAQDLSMQTWISRRSNLLQIGLSHLQEYTLAVQWNRSLDQQLMNMPN